MPQPQRDLTRLPRWVQNRIEVLERNVEHWKEQALAGPENSNTFVSTYPETGKPLGMNPNIDFYLGDRKDWTKRISVRIDERLGVPYLNVQVGAGIVVVPQASNVVHIYAERR